MSAPYLGEIRLFPFSFAPQGWAFADGSIVPIDQWTALYALIGPAFGGNGKTTFALPDLRGRVPLHVGPGFSRGQKGGEQTVTLSTENMPAHNHGINGLDLPPMTNAPQGGLLGTASIWNQPGSDLSTMNAASVTKVGGSQPHANMQPYLTLNFCICLSAGVYPEN